MRPSEPRQQVQFNYWHYVDRDFLWAIDAYFDFAFYYPYYLLILHR